MALASVLITLDTTAPGGVTLDINGLAAYTADVDVIANVATTDPVTAGYTMLVWGDVDPAANPSIQATQGASSWITFNTAQVVTLLAGDGTKNLHVIVSDDVGNHALAVSASIELVSAPIVTVESGPTNAKVSMVPTYDTTAFTWQSSENYAAYEVEIVADPTSLHGSGIPLGNANGSANVAGAGGPAVTNVTTTVTGEDLGAASPGDGPKVVKVFVQNAAGTWSL